MHNELYRIAKFVNSLESKPGKKRISPETISLHDKNIHSPQLEDYLKMSSLVDIKSFCRPLENLGIQYFQYIRKSNENQYFHLTNNPEWLNHFFRKQYYLTEFFHNPDQKYSSGTYFWHGLPDQESVHQDLRDFFNVDWGITNVQIHQDCNEFFYFGVDKNRVEMINFYVNCFHLLQRFILYFKDSFMDMTEARLNKRVIVPTRKNYSSTIALSEVNTSLFYQQTRYNRYYLSGLMSNLYFTKREMECLKWYIEGKTTPEIAIILTMSARTVETHLNRIKSKTNCYSRGQLCYQFANLQI